MRSLLTVKKFLFLFPKFLFELVLIVIIYLNFDPLVDFLFTF